MTCVLCMRRPAERPQACEPCRLWLPGVLRDVADGHAVLDLTARSAGAAQRVSGSREAPVPLALETLDLAAAARLGSRGPHARGVLGDDDQVGHLAVATELEYWVIDWIGERAQVEHRPDPTVPTLARWLDVRMDWACDRHPAVDEFAADLRDLRAVLRRANGDLPQRPTPLVGVPCSRCDQKALYRDPESAWRATCGNCGRLYSELEYADWTGLLAAAHRRSDHIE